ncbi:MAG: S49 family peptidase, partial [Halobacteriaceae archaeon]
MDLRTQSDRISSLIKRAWQSYVIVVIIGLIIGLLIAPFAWQWGASANGTIAVIPLEGTIDGETAERVVSMIKKAQNNPSIKAIVIIVNSPGGAASSSEKLYLHMAAAADQMPVVASVGAIAASGAYYAIAPADYIYAKPSSLVGSIGVFATMPSDIEPIKDIITTGPNKLSGGSSRDWQYKLEAMRRAFVNAVAKNRQENLTISKQTFSQGGIYSGALAAKYGLIDAIGGRQSAIRRAARMANLDSYTVKVLRPEGVTVEFLTRTAYLASSAPKKELIS